jgi:ribosomal protein S18 acetylase RimI-like enzyme
MVTRWADHRPDDHGGAPPSRFATRDALEADCVAVARLEADRGDFSSDDAEARCRRHVRDPDTLLVVALVGDEVVGFGRAGRFEPADDAPPDVAPPGWYLFGVIVPDHWRRRGIGRRLTEHRLARIREQAGEVFYFTNARNRASIDLHAALGFVEISRSFTFPGATFEGGSGILFRLAWEPIRD